MARRKTETSEEKLNDRQARFVYEYQIDYNGTQAAIRAGYSPHTAQEQASRLLKHPLVKQMIETSEQARLKRLEISADRIRNELAKIAFANMADYATWGPRTVKLKDSSKLTREDTAAICEVYQKTGKVSERGIKLQPKVPALELLAKLDDELKEKLKQKHEVTGKGGGPIETAATVTVYIPDNGRGDRNV